MPEHVSGEILPSDLLESPAVKAWKELGPERAAPGQVEILKGRRTAGRKTVYRLVGAGPGGCSVIAKRYRRAGALLEGTLYEEIFPRLPVPTPRYFGSVEETGGGLCWLFLEDVGGENYSAAVEAHRRLAGRWLGLLQASAARVAPSGRLPYRGPDHYRGRLRSTRDRIRESLVNPALLGDDLAVLETILSQCDALEARWDRVARFCEGMPRTLVHGDFVGKNLRVRQGDAGIVLLLFDWACAGWGVPAVDLAQAPPSSPDFSASPDLAAYGAAVCQHWPWVDPQTVQGWANLGTLLRSLTSINWDALSLAHTWVEEAMTRMRFYQATMAHAMQAAGWAGGV